MPQTLFLYQNALHDQWFASRQEDSPALKAVAALRNQFGGHAVHS